MYFTGKARGAICLELDELGEMAFLSDQYLRAVFFFAVGIVIAVAILMIWENEESVLREIRRQFDSNEARDRKSTRLNSSHVRTSRMPSSA